MLNLHFKGRNNFFLVNVVGMNYLKAKDSEIKPYPFCIGNILKDFTIDGIKRAGLKEYVHAFSVGYNIIDTNNILDIHKYLMKIT